MHTRSIAVFVFMLAAVPGLARAQAGGEPPSSYELDPVTDSIIAGLSFVGGLGSELTIRSGELQAAEPAGKERIPFYDRWVVESGDVDTSGDLLSNIGLGAAIVYAIADSVRSGYRDGSDEGWTDTILYLESGLANWAIANVVKLTVRRPRPNAYLLETPDRVDTNRELSFYSAHSAVTGGLVGTAAYLIFEREGGSAEAWTVFGAGTALTAFVSWNRVRVKAHFPSDVVVGSLVGAAIGVMVPHLHLREPGAPTVAFYGDGRHEAGAVMALSF